MTMPVSGARGLIGSALVTGLLTEGRRVVRLVRHDSGDGHDFSHPDFGHALAAVLGDGR